MLLFTDLMNNGNPDDKNPGSVQNFDKAINVASWLFVVIFGTCILVHLFFILKSTCRQLKQLLQREYKYIKVSNKREKEFHLILENKDKTPFLYGLCFRMCCRDKAYEQDKEVGVIKSLRDKERKSQINQDIEGMKQVVVTIVDRDRAEESESDRSDKNKQVSNLESDRSHKRQQVSVQESDRSHTL